jgi:hypothetical protein
VRAFPCLDSPSDAIDMIRTLVRSFLAFVASRTVWINAVCSWAASCLQLPEMTMGRTLYSQDDGLRSAIAPTVAYRRKL